MRIATNDKSYLLLCLEEKYYVHLKFGENLYLGKINNFLDVSKKLLISPKYRFSPNFTLQRYGKEYEVLIFLLMSLSDPRMWY